MGSLCETDKFAVKADAFFVRHDDGVWLRNNHGSFSINGAGAYELVETVFANLDGERSVADLCAGLPEAASRSVQRLIGTLANNGFVKRVEHPIEQPPEWMRERYAAHLAFLDHHADRPVTRMTRMRSRQVVCAGSGVACRALLGALAEFGIARLLVLTPDPTVVADVAENVERDPMLRWTARLVDGPELAGLGDVPEVAEADEVMIAVDEGDPGEIADVQMRLRASGKPVAVLGRCGDFAVSVSQPADADWCWECVHRSIAAEAVGDTEHLAPAATPASFAALHAVQHAFTRLVDVDLEGSELVTTVEPLAPVVRTHRGRQHPLCGRHDAPTAPVPERVELVRPDVPSPHDTAELLAVSDRIVGVSAAWTDRTTGPLLALGEEDADQLPLSASTCLVADPTSTASERRSHLLVCHAVSPREARNQVVLSALEWLAERLRAEGVGSTDARSGAGWTDAEAWYRAVAAWSLALCPESLTWQSLPSGWVESRPVAAFLAETLAAEGRRWQGTALEQLPTGFHRARIRTADYEVAAGVGIDPDHAVGNALLTAVAAGRDGTVAHLAPPVESWQDAVDAVRESGKPPEPVDVSHRLPFLGADARLVEIPGGLS